MIIVSSNIQQKVLKVRKLWAGEGRTACAIAGLGERKAGVGAEREKGGAPIQALAQEMGVRPDCWASWGASCSHCQGWGELCWAQDVVLHPFAAVWCLSARKFTEFKIFKITKWLWWQHFPVSNSCAFCHHSVTAVIQVSPPLLHKGEEIAVPWGWMWTFLFLTLIDFLLQLVA